MHKSPFVHKLSAAFKFALVAFTLAAYGNGTGNNAGTVSYSGPGNGLLHAVNHESYGIPPGINAGQLGIYDTIITAPRRAPAPIIDTFPSLHITSYYDPFVQVREFWHDGTLTLTGAPDIFNFEEVDIRIRGRGNSTWIVGPDKRPLRIRFRTPQPLMSYYEARDWVLLANHFDRSLMRNYSAFYLGNMLSGLYFTPVPRHVHLYVNGEYMGVYLVTDERNTGPGRLQLAWHEDPAKSCFFLELDVRAPETGILDETFITVQGLHYDLRYPNDLEPGHVEYVRAYLTAVSSAIRSRDFDEVLTLIDLASFVDFYIVQEFFKDIDARDLSTFMYITGTGESRRLFMGPIWDFDLAAGNARNQPLGYGPRGLYVAAYGTWTGNIWFANLMQIPEFFDAVKTRWNEIRYREIAQTIERIRTVTQTHQHEFERNFERHPDVMGREQMPTPQGILEIDYFMGHVEHLTDWLETRANWLDDFLNGRLPPYDHMMVWLEYQISRPPISLKINGEAQRLNFPLITAENHAMILRGELEAIFGIHYDLPPELLIVRNYTFVPLRQFAVAHGYDISWDQGARAVIINFER